MKNKTLYLFVICLIINTASIFTQQISQNNNQTQSATNQRFTGTGGKGIRIAVTKPNIIQLHKNDEWIAQFIQDLITSDLSTYSAMTVIDRTNEHMIIAEQEKSLSLSYSENSYIKLGNLTNAAFIVTGNIHYINNIYKCNFRINNTETNEIKAAFTKDFSLQDIQSGRAAKHITASLLSELGITLTQEAKNQLLSVENPQTYINNQNQEITTHIIPEISYNTQKKIESQTQSSISPQVIRAFRGDSSDFIKGIEEKLQEAYFYNNFSLAYSIIESAIQKIEFNNVHEYNVLFAITERICRNEDIKSLSLLVKYGLNLNIDDEDGNVLLGNITPSLTFIQKMISLGAKPMQRSIYNWESSLTKAIKNKNKDVSLFLIENYTLEALYLPDLSGKTAFHLACEYMQLDSAQAILKKGFKIDYIVQAPKSNFSVSGNNQGKTALMIACQQVQNTLVYFLIKNGANVFIKDVKGNTTIHMASTYKKDSSISIHQSQEKLQQCIEIIDILVTSGVDINSKNKYDQTALMMLVDTSSYIEISLVKNLLSQGAHPSSKDIEKRTPLHAAIEWTNYDLAKTLLTYGADVNAKDSKGNTPLSIAQSHKYSNLENMLLSAGAIQ